MVSESVQTVNFLKDIKGSFCPRRTVFVGDYEVDLIV